MAALAGVSVMHGSCRLQLQGVRLELAFQSEKGAGSSTSGGPGSVDLCTSRDVWRGSSSVPKYCTVVTAQVSQYGPTSPCSFLAQMKVHFWMGSRENATRG